MTKALITQLALFQILLVGVWSMLGDQKSFRIGITLTILSGLLTVIYAFLPYVWLGVLIALITLTFLFFSSYIAFKSVFSIGQININQLYGAACIYLMLALIWAIFYMLIDLFLGPNLSNLNAENAFWEYLYFSFVTLTTLGYGDISPLTPASRVLAGFEAVVGQFYLTILVAALVGLHISQFQIMTNNEKKDDRSKKQ